MRYICRDYFQRTVCSGRFVLLVLLVWISLCSFFREFVEQLSEMHCRVGALEIFPAWAFCGGGVSTYFILFIFLILAYPQWDGAVNRLARQGRKMWLLSQYCYVIMTSVIYYLVVTVGFIIALFPVVDWKNRWSSFYWKASDPKTGFDFETGLKYNLPCTYSRKIMKIGTPLKVWGLTFLLVVLASIFLGMLVVTFNIWFRRGTGTILGIFVLVFYYIMDWIPLFFDNEFAQFDGYKQIQNRLWRLEPYLSPLYQTDVYGLTLRKARPVMERVEIAAVYYIVLAVVVLVMGLRMVRKVDLSKD